MSKTSLPKPAMSPTAKPVPGGFDLASVMSDSAYPFTHTFTGSGFDGLTIKYREAPTDFLPCILEIVSEPLQALGFDPIPTTLHLLFGKELTGPDFNRFEDAADALTATQKLELEETMAGGVRNVVVHLVGAWNATEPIEVALLPLLIRFPSLTRALFQLAKAGLDTQAK